MDRGSGQGLQSTQRKKSMSTGGKAPCAVQVSGADDSVMVDEVHYEMTDDCVCLNLALGHSLQGTKSLLGSIPHDTFDCLLQVVLRHREESRLETGFKTPPQSPLVAYRSEPAAPSRPERQKRDVMVMRRVKPFDILALKAAPGGSIRDFELRTGTALRARYDASQMKADKDTDSMGIFSAVMGIGRPTEAFADTRG